MAILAPFLTQLLGDIWKQQSIKVVPIVVSIPKPSHIQTMPPTSIWSGDNVRSKFESFLFFIFLVLTNGVAISSLTFIAPVHKPPESESLLLWITMGALRSSLWSIRTLHSYLLYVAAIPNIYSVSSGNNFFGTIFRSLVLRLTSPLPASDVRLSQVPGPGWSLTRGGSSPGSTLAVTIQSSEERWTKERWEKGQNDRLRWSFFFNECVEYLHSGFQEFSTRPISTRTNGKGDKCF